MQSQSMPIKNFLTRFEIALSEYGLSYSYRLRTLQRASVIIRLHEEKGLECIDAGIVADYNNDVAARFYSGKLTRHHFTNLQREVARFTAFAIIGHIHLPNQLKGSTISLTPEYEQIASDYFPAKCIRTLIITLDG